MGEMADYYDDSAYMNLADSQARTEEFHSWSRRDFIDHDGDERHDRLRSATAGLKGAAYRQALDRGAERLCMQLGAALRAKGIR